MPRMSRLAGLLVLVAVIGVAGGCYTAPTQPPAQGPYGPHGPPPPVAGCLDDDGDGYCADLDCDDGNPGIHPGAGDILADGLDSNCDGYQ